MYHLLVCDDEEKIRALIRKYAEFEGHTVREAKNGVEAVRLAAAYAFDLIIMDIMMPELDGISASREIRRQSDTPILILSARVRNTTASTALRSVPTIMSSSPSRPRS